MSVENNISFIMAERLRLLRVSKNLSHNKLSEALSEKYDIKISSDSLMNYEVAEATHTKAYKNIGMRVEYLRCLADFYGVSADYILGLAEEQTPNLSARAVCQYTGLSAEAAEILHATKSNDFTSHFVDAILRAVGIEDDLQKDISESAQAVIVASAGGISDLLGIKSEIENRVATISRNGSNQYFISADTAAKWYLSSAINIATSNIADVIRKIRDDLAISLAQNIDFSPKLRNDQNADSTSVMLEFLKIDERDIPSE